MLLDLDWCHFSWFSSSDKESCDPSIKNNVFMSASSSFKSCNEWMTAFDYLHRTPPQFRRKLKLELFLVSFQRKYCSEQSINQLTAKVSCWFGYILLFLGSKSFPFSFCPFLSDETKAYLSTCIFLLKAEKASAWQQSWSLQKRITESLQSYQRTLYKVTIWK